MKKTFIFWLSFIVAFVQVVLLGCNGISGLSSFDASLYIAMPINYNNEYIVKAGVVPKGTDVSGCDFPPIRSVSEKTISIFETYNDYLDIPAFKLCHDEPSKYILYDATSEPYDFTHKAPMLSTDVCWDYNFYFEIYDKSDKLIEKKCLPLSVPRNNATYKNIQIEIETTSLKSLIANFRYSVTYSI